MESAELEMLETVFVKDDEMQTYINFLVADKRGGYLAQFYDVYRDGNTKELYKEIEDRIQFLLNTI
jgi:hypothetical protein